jgi:3-hydroxy-9,10-secoandrosta-1,3,5(10)-triene-9,17-dione monooxygenase
MGRETGGWAMTAIDRVAGPFRGTPPSEDELVRRAAVLVPTVRARAAEADVARRLSDETLDDLVAAGFFRIVQPRRFGGYELGALTLVRVMTELSRGDASTGWVTSLTAGHTKWLAYYPMEGQREVFGEDGDARLPLVVAPQGEAVAVDDGYVLSGAWRYASGCDVTNWLAVNAMVRDDAGNLSGVVSAIIARGDYEVVDDWHVLGMRGTGSKQAVVRGVVVPARRVVALGPDREPVVADPVHPSGFYRAPMAPFFALELGAVLVGLGRAALEHFGEWAVTKTSAYPPFSRPADVPATQLRFARATAMVDASEATLHHVARDYDQRAATDQGYDGNDVRRALLRVQWLADEVAAAVDLLSQAAGTAALTDGSHLQRCIRDLAMARSHYLLDSSRTGASWSQFQFGLEPASVL